MFKLFGKSDVNFQFPSGDADTVSQLKIHRSAIGSQEPPRGAQHSCNNRYRPNCWLLSAPIGIEKKGATC